MQLQPDLPPEVLAPVDTRVRFSLRGVFIAIALIAAWLAAVTPWFRQWNADERGAFLLVWCSMALGAVLMAVFLYSRRVRAQRRAGAVRFRLPMPIARYASVISLGAGVSLFGLSTAIGFYQAMNPSSRAHGGIWVWNLIACQCGATLAMGGLGTRWKTTEVELCDGGIVTGFGMLPWEKTRGFRIGGDDHRLLVLHCPWTVLTVRVDASATPAIERFLSSRLPADPMTYLS